MGAVPSAAGGGVGVAEVNQENNMFDATWAQTRIKQKAAGEGHNQIQSIGESHVKIKAAILDVCFQIPISDDAFTGRSTTAQWGIYYSNIIVWPLSIVASTANNLLAPDKAGELLAPPTRSTKRTLVATGLCAQTVLFGSQQCRGVEGSPRRCLP